MMPRLARLAAALLTALVLAAPLARAGDPPPLDQVQRADGAVAVPERFLRPWDPVTVFFPDAAGPDRPAPEDHPERVVTLSPPQPGAWQWLGPKVLQFRPAEPWSPLRRVRVQAGGRSATLVPLLPEPVQTSPQDQPEGIAGLDTISLTFPGPVDPAALARLLTIELRRLPGIDAAGAERLTAADFEIRPLEQARRGDRQTYLVVLRHPLPDQRLAILRLRLSDEPGLDDPVFTLRLRTATPFVLEAAQCADGFETAVTDGVRVCSPGAGRPAARGITLAFSAPPAGMDVLGARNALRISPPVDGLEVAADPDNPQALRLTGAFAAETEYTLGLAPGALVDRRGRALTGPAVVERFAFRPSRPRLAWEPSAGIVEREGPQMVPLHGQGYDRADLRIHRIDPLDRDFWPFPGAGITTDDAAPPPLAGNEPQPWTAASPIPPAQVAARLKALGSPSVSELVDLPRIAGGREARFGLDLQPLLARIAGPRQPGSYLVGLRPLQGGGRHWIRLDVTDLALSAVEEPERIRFFVTSLATARPVAGATVRVEGVRGDAQVTLASGTTDEAGAYGVVLPDQAQGTPRRVIVQKGADTLVLGATPGPDRYEGGHWSKPQGTWLARAFAHPAGRAEAPRLLCHIFTEQPIYRPEAPVEIRGFVRAAQDGALRAVAGRGGAVLIRGPGDRQWRLPVTLDATSGFHLHFDARTDATGDYAVSFEPEGGGSCQGASFRKEAYRLPSFEVLLDHAREVALDAPFQVALTARYYAGGGVADRPITWRVTQFPRDWHPHGEPGFLFSSDSRFAEEQQFRSTPVLQSQSRTDAGGMAALSLDPTIEPTAQPRTYMVEATVTGDDGQQIRSVAEIPALPPFTLGARLPRYLEKPGAISADLLALDGEGKPYPQLDMTVRLIKRDWNSVLRAADFTQGAAKYSTEQIDRTIEERHVTSGARPQTVTFAAAEAGVYILEVTAADRLGRRQTLRVDCFMAGDTPVTWSPPPARSVTLKADKDEYSPGEPATLLIESPFQTARALVVTERPDRTFDYAWADVANGVGRVTLPVQKTQAPGFAVHVLLMRGRLGGGADPAAPFDLGKPATLAATAWVKVRPVQNRVNVAFQAPASARPAETVDIALRLTDEAGRPLAGEATVWMVDQAVLALAKEAPLDPLPKFVLARPARLAARDTRNLALGYIPQRETPGGASAPAPAPPGMPNISVRRNFTPVPVYLPHVKVGPDGIAHVRVTLPDSLTVYMLRAEVTSGPDRFGFATGRMEIRQPVIAQPVLPRFLRRGDQLQALLLGRVVDGQGGAGEAGLSVEGVRLDGSARQSLSWTGAAPARATFPLSVPETGPAAARLGFLVRRAADGVGDAAEITLPILPDRPPVRERRLADVAPGASVEFPPPPGAIRPGSFSRALAVAADPALTRALAAMDALLAYPFGCTEQRIALAASDLALLRFGPIAGAEGLDRRAAQDVASALQAIQRAVDENGLVAYWPRTRGLVTLTAWSYELMVRARAAGMPVDAALQDRLATVLAQSLRSDYPHLLTGAALRERAASLRALAVGGRLDAAYASELARIGGALDTDGIAMVISAIAAVPQADQALLAGLLATMWQRVQIVARGGAPAYGGITEFAADPLVLPSETRSLAEVIRAATATTPADPRLAVLRAGLLGLGGADGWGSTNANAAALQALSLGWEVGGRPVPLTATLAQGEREATLDAAAPLAHWDEVQPQAVRVANRGEAPVVALSTVRYVPAEPGWQAPPVQKGFAVTRRLFRVPAAGGALVALAPQQDGALHLALGDTVEELAEVVVPEARSMVAISLPLAAGLEPLNPALANAPAEATPSAAPTLTPTYTAFGDDSVLYVYESLPAGTYQFRLRARAATAGRFTQPAGTASMMYREGVEGASAGAAIAIGP